MNHPKGQTNCNYLLIGDLCLDLFVQMEIFPKKGGDGSIQRVFQHSGGSAANTAIALAKLGGKPTLLTHTGSDNQAKQILSILKDLGVSTKRIVQESSKATGMTISVVTNDAERTLLTYRGANSSLRKEEISESLFLNVDFLHISSYTLMETQQSEAVIQAVKLASTLNVGISLDVATVQPNESLQQLLPYLSLIVLGKTEALAITHKTTLADAIQYLIDVGVKTIGLKMGKDGSRLISKELDLTLESFFIKAVDTTGAGDAFCAGLIYGITHQWTMEMSGKLANAMGALVASRWGAGEKMPSVKEISKFLSQYNDPVISLILNALNK